MLQRACWTPDAILNDTFEIPALYEDLATVQANFLTHETWVLRRGPRLIGAVRGVLRGTDWEVGRLMVAPDLQGQGLGRMLLRHIEHQAPGATRRLWLFTGKRSEANIRLYTRAGYHLVPDDDDSLPHVPHTVRLVKHVPAGPTPATAGEVAAESGGAGIGAAQNEQIVTEDRRDLQVTTDRLHVTSDDVHR
ncbi:MAG: GNAT family N-acetyltransferase [Micropruina sp.]